MTHMCNNGYCDPVCMLDKIPPGSWISPFIMPLSNNAWVGQEIWLMVPVPIAGELWNSGMRYQVYTGRYTNHHSGGFCLQPEHGEECIAFENGMLITAVRE